MALVSFEHPSIRDFKPQWQIVNDVIAGASKVKSRGTLYLPHPTAYDPADAEDVARYNAYRTRAVFYGITARTLRGMVGQIFGRDPKVELPSILKPVELDMTGSKTPFFQHAKSTCNKAVALGRVGLFTDYTNVAGREVTQEDINTGRVRPTIRMYSEGQIINWRYLINGGQKKLCLVVLYEEEWVVKPGSLFEMIEQKQWRVLRLDESGNYIQELYTTERGGTPQNIEVKGADGQPLDFIPFEFIGSEDNDAEIDPVPLYDMADLNLAHYRNSADWEEELHLHGQATLVATGMTETWVKNILKGRLPLGARAIVPLPQGADLKLVQIDPTPTLAAEMERKKTDMISLGAKLVEHQKSTRTATEANQDEAAESSQLSTIADNVSSAYENSFKHALRLVARGSNEKVTVELNTEFELTTLDPAERAQLLKEWIAEAITTSEYRGNLRRAGIASLDDKSYAKEMQEQTKLFPHLEDNEPAEGDDTQEGGNSNA